MIPQLETLNSQRFFYMNESGIEGVGFNGKLWRWGSVEVSLPLMGFYKNITNLNNIFSIDSFFSNLTFFVHRMYF